VVAIFQFQSLQSGSHRACLLIVALILPAYSLFDSMLCYGLAQVQARYGLRLRMPAKGNDAGAHQRTVKIPKKER
jgi:hypothetical protein